MNAQETIKSNEFNKCLDFHGHLCPGLSIGFRAAKAGMEHLKENERSIDEEIVAITETNSCGVDAIQVITGCTFGKGNLIYRDYGKSVFTFVSRKSGKGIRIALKNNGLRVSDKHFDLINKIRKKTASDQDQEEFKKIHYQRSVEVLEAPITDLFTITEVNNPIPDKAIIEKSTLCKVCKEPVMPSKLDENQVCKSCKLNIE